MNFFDMTPDDWALLGIVIVILALPSLLKPLSNWLGRLLGVVAPEAPKDHQQP